MKITYSNYPEQIKKVDWSKVPANIKSAKDEMNEFHELYNDDDTIKETFDLFLDQLNKVLAKQDVKKVEPKKKQITRNGKVFNPKFKVKDIVSLKPSVLKSEPTYKRNNIGTIKTVIENNNDVYYEVISEQDKGVSTFEEKDLIKFKTPDVKKQSSSKKQKFKVGDYVYWIKNSEEVRYGKEPIINYDRVDKIVGTEKDVHGTLRYKTKEVLLGEGKPRVGLAYESYLVKATLEEASKNIPNKKQSSSTKPKPKFKVGDVVYLKQDYKNYKKGQELEVFLVGNKSIDVKCCGGKIQKAFTVFDLSILSKAQKKVEKTKTKAKPNKAEQKPTKKESPCDDAIENYLEKKQEARAKASAKRKRTKIKEALDQETVNFYNAEFRLLRRFKNLVTKEAAVTFRSVQLLYMAFQKHSVARKVRKTSELANLYEICSKKLTKLLQETKKQGKDTVKITFADKDVLEQLVKLTNNKKVDYAISLINRVINLQGTAPDDKKAQRLINSISNAFKNGKVDERSRLYDDLVAAKKDLQKYLDDKVEKIPTENYGLSGVKKKDATVVSSKNNKTITLPNPIKPKNNVVDYVDTFVGMHTNNVGKNVDLSVDLDVDNVGKNDKTPVNNNNNTPTTNQQQEIDSVGKTEKNTPTEPTATPTTLPTKKIKNVNVLSTDDIMSMEFDTLNFTGKWYDFMQSPAKNMRIAFKGKPKNGKTSGCMALANILTNYGNVLYNFADQGINKSTQDLWVLSGLKEKENAFLTETRNLKDLDKLCASGDFDFIFIDMINTYIHRTGIKYYEFEDQFLKKYPNISFILVFEATKSGDFKGDQGWTHLVDAIVDVENYVLHNNGRYGVGEYVVWEEGLKKQNPKKYKQFFGDKEKEEAIINL